MIVRALIVYFMRQILARIISYFIPFFYITGIMQLISKIRKSNGAIILMYHSVADKEELTFIDPSNHIDPEIFELQMKYLSKNKNVIFMSELVNDLIHGHDIKKNTVIITFDDGYLDNYFIAAPILQKYNLKATIFLPTGYISRAEMQWVDMLYNIVCKRKNNRTIYQGIEYNLSNNTDFNLFYKQICHDLITVESYSKRNKILDDLAMSLDTQCQLPKLTMSWEDVNKMLSEYKNIEIGGHTVDHLDLSNKSISDIRNEINISWNQIKDFTKTTPSLFSCPYGRNSEEVMKLLAEESQYIASIGDCNPNVTVNDFTNIWDIKRVESTRKGLKFRIDCCNSNTGIWRNLTNKRR